MNPETTQVDDIQLVALPTALNCTELFVRFALTEWSLRPLIDEATVVARAVVETAIDESNPKVPDLLTIRLRLRSDSLVVEVSGGRVHRPMADPGGHRTQSVPLGGRGGQLVWSELPLPGGMDASAVPLPRRTHRRSNAAGASAEQHVSAVNDEVSAVDEDVMRRILFGLNQPDRGRP